MLKLAATAIAVSSLIATSGAFAVDLVRYEPKVTLPPAPMSAPARSMNILNVTLGMSYADARPMLQRALPTAEIVVPRAAFQLNYKGVLVQTPDFANTVSVQRKQDETGSNEYLVLRFSGPASGNQLIAISRILNYADPLKAPTVSDVRTAIFKKYGEASRITDSGRNNFSADWTIAGGKLPSCTNGAWANCPPFGAEYDAMSLSNYTKDMSQFDFLLKVSVFSSFQDQEKASGVSVYLTSLTRRKAAAVADFQSLIDEGARIISQTATTAVAPKL